MSMDHSPHAIRKQNIHFVRLYDLSYLTFAKRGMHQYLTLSIRSPLVIRGGGFSGST
jgi:hypothetical protein